jgi:putative ABC transport system permease protein
VSTLLQDLRYALRQLRKSPGFAAVAVITLALGIGANTAIFSVTSALLLRPFPYQKPEQLVSITQKDKSTSIPLTLLRYEFVRDHNKSFDSVAVWANDTFNLTGHGDPVQIAVARVSPNFFGLLGVKPSLGRSFTESEGRPEGQPVVILSDSLWRSRFNGDESIVGQTITLDTAEYTVVGVLPPNLQFPFVGEADLWTPRYFEFTLMSPQRLRQGVGYLAMLGRLRPGTSLGQARAELAVLDQQYRQQNPAMPDAVASRTMAAEPLRDLVVGDLRQKLLVLSAAVGVVLLIACANVASLLLSRALARKKEVAIRTALGASRAVIVRQLLTESMLLALTAGVLGIGFSWLATRALLAWGADQLPSGIPIGIGSRVLLFTLAISLLTGIIFGIFPALQLSRNDTNATLREEGRESSAGHTRVRAKSMLVVSQVALALLLLIECGLLVRSFTRLLATDPGFEAGNLLTMHISLPTVKYARPEQQTAFFDEVLRRVSSLPGVRDAAISAAKPLSWIRVTPVLPEGQPDVPLTQRPFIDIEAISPQWFKTLRVPLVGGRDFTDADNAQSHRVIIVNQTFARRYWPDENAIGKHVLIGRATDAAEVVGIAKDIRNHGLADDTQAQIYLPFPQLPWGAMNLLVRSAVGPLSLTSAIRAQIAAVDPDQPVTGIQTGEDLMGEARTQPRFTTMLLASFALAALLLAVTGIYGVLAYSVAQRKHELGIRMALGAERADIVRLVVRQGVSLALAGIVIGLIAAALTTKLLATMLYRTSTRDLMTFAVAPLFFFAVSFLASYLPAWSATKVDPIVALRYE